MGGCKLLINLMLICSLATTRTALSGVPEGPKEVEAWFRKLSASNTQPQKVTKLNFYLQDLQGRTTTVVARSNDSLTQPYFGLTFMADDPLTAGPSQASKVIGRAQGMYAAASKGELRLVMAMNFIFTDGPHNGSTLAILGSNPTLHPKREVVVVGGTGTFRLARGVALLNIIHYDVPGGNATVEYNIVLNHY